MATTVQPIIIQVNNNNPYEPTVTYDPKNFKGDLSKKLGIVQLISGLLAIILSLIGYFIILEYDRIYLPADDDPDHNGYQFHGSISYYIGCGVWIPVLFISVSGAVAIYTGFKVKASTIRNAAAVGLISTIFSFVMLCTSLWAFIDDCHRLQKDFYYPNNPYRRDEKNYMAYYSSTAARVAKASLAVSTLLSLVSIAQTVACVWATHLCFSVRIPIPHNQVITTTPDARYAANPHMSDTQLLVLDSKGRPVPGAQLVKVPSTSRPQTPEPFHPGFCPKVSISTPETCRRCEHQQPQQFRCPRHNTEDDDGFHDDIVPPRMDDLPPPYEDFQQFPPR